MAPGAASVDERSAHKQPQVGYSGNDANSPVLYNEDRCIATITLNRPKVKNAISDAVYLRLLELLQYVAARDSVVAVILTGAAGYFTSGADLKEATRTISGMGVGISLPTVAKPVGRFMAALLSFPKVLVAAVNGPAVGIGVTILPHCDVVYAYGGRGVDAPGEGGKGGAAAAAAGPVPKAAVFWTPFFRLSFVPEFSSSVTFPEIMGWSLANEMLMFGRKLDAQEALAAGLVSRVITADTQEDFVSQVQDEVRRSLAQQRMAGESGKIFKRIMRRARRPVMLRAMREELSEFDKRLQAGHVQATLKHLAKGPPPGSSKL